MLREFISDWLTASCRSQNVPFFCDSNLCLKSFALDTDKEWIFRFAFKFFNMVMKFLNYLNLCALMSDQTKPLNIIPAIKRGWQ